MKVIHAQSGHIIVSQLAVATSFRTRLCGLMFRRVLSDGEGMLFPRCKSIHTCFMRFPLDVLFLDDHGRIVHMISHMVTWRFSPLVRAASTVLECPSGTIDELHIHVGDTLETLA